MNTFDQIASRIIKDQELIIGPLAWDEAASVNGLTIVNKEHGEVTLDTRMDHGIIIDQLVNKYVELFGRAAREACREATIALVADLPPSDVPSSLK